MLLGSYVSMHRGHTSTVSQAAASQKKHSAPSPVVSVWWPLGWSSESVCAARDATKSLTGSDASDRLTASNLDPNQLCGTGEARHERTFATCSDR